MESTKVPKRLLRKCPGCGEDVNINEAIHMRNRYWHVECYQNREKKDNKAQEELLKKKAIHSYLEQIGIETTAAVVTRKRNELVRDYEYSDTGILMALKYWYGVKKNSIEKAVGSGLGIVPYIYDEAQAYYKNLIELKMKLRQNYEQNQDTNAKTIKIKKDKKPKDKGLIDINALKECE